MSYYDSGTILLAVVNPSMKFEWMKKHWLDEEVDQAHEWVKESVVSCGPLLCMAFTSPFFLSEVETQIQITNIYCG